MNPHLDPFSSYIQLSYIPAILCEQKGIKLLAHTHFSLLAVEQCDFCAHVCWDGAEDFPVLKKGSGLRLVLSPKLANLMFEDSLYA